MSNNISPETKPVLTEYKWRFETASGILDHENKYVGAYGRKLVDAHNAAIDAATAKLLDKIKEYEPCSITVSDGIDRLIDSLDSVNEVNAKLREEAEGWITNGLNAVRGKEREIAQLDHQLVKLKEELAYMKLQRDRLLEITWLDLPGGPDESTSKWQEQFNKGWVRRVEQLAHQQSSATTTERKKGDAHEPDSSNRPGQVIVAPKGSTPAAATTPEVETIVEHTANSIWWNVCGHYKHRADFVRQAKPFVAIALAQAREPLVNVAKEAIPRLKGCMCAGSDGHRLNLDIAKRLAALTGTEEEKP